MLRIGAKSRLSRKKDKLRDEISDAAAFQNVYGFFVIIVLVFLQRRNVWLYFLWFCSGLVQGNNFLQCELIVHKRDIVALNKFIEMTLQ